MKPVVHFAEADPDLRQAYAELCSTPERVVETSADGLECLLLLAESLPEVIVVDLEIPWGGGDGVLDWVRQQAAAVGRPRIIVTGDDAAVDLSVRTGIPPGHCFQYPFRIGSLPTSI